jgi:hypothetical protein
MLHTLAREIIIQFYNRKFSKDGKGPFQQFRDLPSTKNPPLPLQHLFPSEGKKRESKKGSAKRESVSFYLFTLESLSNFEGREQPQLDIRPTWLVSAFFCQPSSENHIF